MRGYYRAVKREEPWAVRIARLIIDSPMQGLMALMYRNADMRDLVYNSNPFLSMVSKTNDWAGHYLPLPIKLSKK